MKRVLLTSMNYSHEQIHGEANDGTDVTVPDMTISIRKLIENHTRGVQDPRSRAMEPIWHGEDDVPDIKKMDFQEIKEMHEDSKQEFESAKTDYQKIQKQEVPEKYKKAKPKEQELLEEISKKLDKTDSTKGANNSQNS